MQRRAEQGDCVSTARPLGARDWRIARRGPRAWLRPALRSLTHLGPLLASLAEATPSIESDDPAPSQQAPVKPSTSGKCFAASMTVAVLHRRRAGPSRAVMAAIDSGPGRARRVRRIGRNLVLADFAAHARGILRDGDAWIGQNRCAWRADRARGGVVRESLIGFANAVPGAARTSTHPASRSGRDGARVLVTDDRLGRWRRITIETGRLLHQCIAPRSAAVLSGMA